MAQSVLLQNARLIDGLTDQPREKISIQITGERITAVGQDLPTPPAGSRVIDLGGKTVVPGLIDTHIHSTLMDSESLPLFLAAGVTSARDVGGKLEKVTQLKADLNSGTKLGPRLFVCGPLLDGPDQSFHYSGPFGEMLDNIPSPEAVPQKINSLFAAGVDGVKLYFTLPHREAGQL